MSPPNVVLGQIRGEAVYVFDLEPIATVIALHRKGRHERRDGSAVQGRQGTAESDIWLLGAINGVYSTNLDAA